MKQRRKTGTICSDFNITMNEYTTSLMTFASVAHAMRFEKIMKTENVEFKLIPVPRSISVSCGICAKFHISQKDKILKLVSDNNLIYQKLFSSDDELKVNIEQ